MSAVSSNPQRRATVSTRRPRLAAAMTAAAITAATLTVAPLGAWAADATTEPTPVSAVAHPAAPLPFDLPSPAELRGSPRDVFAHYVPWFPISIGNTAPDYYDRHFLTPTGENGKHAAYGGYLRDRPQRRAALSDSAWRLRDLETDVRQAVAAGMDGFIVDIVQLGDTGGVQWTAIQQLLQAARNVDPGFSIMLMPDMTGTNMQSKDAATMAKYMAHLAASPAAHRLADGRLVLSPFTAERKSVDWWKQVLTLLRDTYNTPVAFVPLFQDERKWRTTFAPISYGMTNWGNRNPAWNDPSATGPDSPLGRAAAVKALGKVWMQPVSVQDERPREGIFDEAQNTQNLRNTWKLARDSGAQMVQVPTWNDYAEGSQIAPSDQNGSAWLDLSAYYLTWYKTGTAPKIVRDAVYLTHRGQPHAALPSYAQTLLMKRRGTSSSPARDTVEALTFMTAPATVRVKVGTATHVCEVDAGVDTCTVPLGNGAVSAVVERVGTPVLAVTSPRTVTSTPYVQDLQYVAVSSGRQTQTLRDTAAPSAPSGLTASASGSSVQLSWTPASDDRGVVAYEVHRSATADFTVSSTTRIATTSLPTFVENGVPTGTSHYRVVALDAAGNRSAASSTASASVLDATAPSTVQALSASTNGSSVLLSWGQASDDVGVARYEVHRSTSAGTAPTAATLIASPTGTSHTDLSCSSGTCYYQVLAVDAAGNRGPASVHVSAVVQDTTAPSAPTSLTAALNGQQAALAWAASSDDVGVTAYEVHRSSTTGFAPTSTTLLAAATTSSWSGTAPVGTSYYRVVAKDAAGNRSAASSEARVVVPAPSTVVTVRPSADTYANEGAPSTNFATSSSLSSRGKLGAVSYLRYSIPTAPAGTTLRSAQLSFRTTGESFSGSLDTHAVKVAGNTWTETGLTWKQRPAVTTQVLGTIAGGTLPNTSYKTALSTSAVASFAGSTRTLAITSSGTDNLYVWSSNHSNSSYAPQLVLTYS